jgi:hypothetical protein
MTTSPDARTPARVTRPGFYEVRTPDPARLVHYYEVSGEQGGAGSVLLERGRVLKR